MKISAPGKLFIAGEWAILEPKNFGIVAAIDKRTYAKIKRPPDENISITLKDFKINNLKATFLKDKLRFLKKLSKKEKKILAFSKTAIETALGYLENWRPFQIEIWGDDSRKLGLGFSAASTVAVIVAILTFHQKNLAREEIFKLSALSHYLVQGKIGSGFDIAASVFGGIFVYRRFDPVWLEEQIGKEKNISKIIKKPWPNFYIHRLNRPKNLNLLIGWTGKSALTSQLIKKFQIWREKNQSEYKRLMFGIGKLVKELIRVWKLGRKEKILELIKRNEILLKEFGEKSKLELETKKIKKLVEIAEKFGGAGKLSGAGSGDCGIAICLNKKNSKKVKIEWKKNNILPIKAEIEPSGVKVH